MKKIDEAPCPLSSEQRNMARRDNPRTAFEAHCYALHDALRVVYSLEQVGGPQASRQLESALDTFYGQFRAFAMTGTRRVMELQQLEKDEREKGGKK